MLEARVVTRRREPWRAATARAGIGRTGWEAGRPTAAAAVAGRPRPPGNRIFSRRLVCRGNAMSAEVPEAASAEEQKEMEDKVTSPEKAEEAKLKARYPHLGQKPGGSDFLRKRLQKGQKYFDSGDYNMAKAKMKNKQLPTAAPDKTEVTGDHIPTPQDLPQRKPSLVASKLAG
uniref:cAMP-regulated phosphoprotein 19 n=1 Tax=Urocitellus parryii TaxID=9999 RepID=A0A8D2HA52_UROPR